MKKIIFTLMALVGTMSMNAQVMKIYNGDQLVAKYKSNQATHVVFEEETAITGKVKATIGGSEVDVNWVQLWDGGPKFAEYNVGASSATDTGVEISFTDATAENFTWGANWCTPSKDEMDELLKATSGGSTKVTCEYTQENSVWGFKFTGLTDGYTDNSVFFPAQSGDGCGGDARYWSATANGSEAWVMDLGCDIDYWCCDWSSYNQGFNYLVRPVLKN